MMEPCTECGVIPYDADLHRQWHRNLNDYIESAIETDEGQMTLNRELVEALQRIEARPL